MTIGSNRRGGGWFAALAALAALSIVLGACTGAASPSPSAGGSAGASAAPGSTHATKLVVGLGYIPSVQFAQFYLAQQAGYYRDAGLDVTFQNKIDPDLIVLLGQGSVDIGIADGTSVIPAVSQGIPIRYVATIYGTLPNIVFAKKTSGIAKAADLKGRRIGTPCRCGSNWIMLEALLQSAGLTTSDVQVVEYPDFGQAAAVAEGAIDAATGYVANEPLQLAGQGIPTNVIQLPPGASLPGPGLVAGTGTIAAKGGALRAFVAATLRAMNDIKADPQKGLTAAIAAVPELKSQQAVQAKILDATIASWGGAYTDAHGYGAIDSGAWAQSLAFMSSLPEHLVPKPVTVDRLIDASLLPGG